MMFNLSNIPFSRYCSYLAVSIMKNVLKNLISRIKLHISYFGLVTEGVI